MPCHPEPVADDARALRWVVPAGTLGFVGDVARVPSALRQLTDDGTLATVVAEPTAVRIRLGEGRSWRGEGNRVRAALGTALEDPDGWAPTTHSDPDDVLGAAVAQVIASDVGAYIRSHGGGIRVVAVRDAHVTVELSGSCTHCPAAGLTLAGRFETAVREVFPGLRGVTAHEPAAVPGRRHLGLIPLRRR